MVGGADVELEEVTAGFVRCCLAYSTRLTVNVCKPVPDESLLMEVLELTCTSLPSRISLAGLDFVGPAAAVVSLSLSEPLIDAVVDLRLSELFEISDNGRLVRPSTLDMVANGGAGVGRSSSISGDLGRGMVRGDGVGRVSTSTDMTIE